MERVGRGSVEELPDVDLTSSEGEREGRKDKMPAEAFQAVRQF